MNQGQSSENSGGRPPRRRRYSGTHPRHFAEKYKEHAIEDYPDLEAHLREKGKTPAGTHIPVLVAEVMEALHPASGERAADCTLGYGGHAIELARRIGPGGRLVGLDVDGGQLERARERLGQQCPDVPTAFYRSNFAGLAKIARTEAPEGFDILFADLGLSSMQIDDPQRGMSYRHDGPLDMRMDQRRKQTAADLLGTMTEEAIGEALRDLADEPDHEIIARRIAERRGHEPLTRAGQLVELILEVKGIDAADFKRQRRQNPGLLHPAARTFQALRMLVNDELASLKELLRVAPDCLRAGGRIGILSFHSGEDRLVKQAFAAGRRYGRYGRTAEEVITPGREEIAANPRSASAKFRWAIKAEE